MMHLSCGLASEENLDLLCLDLGFEIQVCSHMLKFP